MGVQISPLVHKKNMERKEIRITESGTYKFGNNYDFFSKDSRGFLLSDCNITCGDNCKIIFGSNCEIICGNNCLIDCGWDCNITCGNDCEIDCINNCDITCGNNCEIDCGGECYIKGGVGSKLKSNDNFFKKISKDEEHIWWYINLKRNLINTYEDVDWKNKNLDKWNEFYAFVHNELDSATLF